MVNSACKCQRSLEIRIFMQPKRDIKEAKKTVMLSEPRPARSIAQLWRHTPAQRYILMLLLIICGTQALSIKARTTTGYSGAVKSSSNFSLRNVLAPMFGASKRDASELESEQFVQSYSLNNRGIQPTPMSLRFGERLESLEGAGKRRQLLEGRRRDDSARAIKWSQPDPRKMYSYPLSLPVIKPMTFLSTREAETNLNKPPTVSKQPGSRANSVASSAKLKRTGIADETNGTSSASDAPEGVQQDGVAVEQAEVVNSERKSSSESSPVLTVVRYVPVLMSVQSDQLGLQMPPPRSSQSAQFVVVKPTAGKGISDGSAPNPFYYATAPIYGGKSATGIEPSRLSSPAGYQVAAEGSVMTPSFEFDHDSAAAHYTPPISATASQQVFMQPTQVVTAASVHASPTSKQALSAYASRLISMLRPSSLLSTIGPTSGYSPRQQQLIYSMIPSQSTPIYLLAGPLSGEQGLMAPPAARYPVSGRLPITVGSIKRPSGQVPQSGITSDELQAGTGLHPSATKMPYWSHQQPNGLICVHGQRTAMLPLLLSASGPRAYAASIKGDPFQVTTTSLPPIDQHEVDHASFEYVAAPVQTASTKQQGPIIATGGQLIQDEGKESPVKLGQRINKKQYKQASGNNNLQTPMIGAQVGHNEYNNNVGQSGGGANDQQNQISISDDTLADHETWMGQQKSTGTVSLESRSATVTQSNNNKNGSNSTEMDRQPTLASPRSATAALLESTTANYEHYSRSSEQRNRYGNGSQSIIPFTIKDKIELPPVRRRQHPSAASRTMHANNNGYPVQYDEPADGEPEVAAGNPSSAGWPTRSPDERRSKTTFVSTPAGSTHLSSSRTRTTSSDLPPSGIDYSREAMSNGYALPLLMASSSVARGRRIETVKKETASPSEDPPAFLRPSVVFRSPAESPNSHLSEPMGAAASSSVTTSSTLDGRPVVLSSGPLGRYLEPSRRPKQHKASSPPPPPPPKTTTITTTTESALAVATTTTSSPGMVELVVNSSAEPAALSVAPSRADGRLVDLQSGMLATNVNSSSVGRERSRTDARAPANHLAHANENNAFTFGSENSEFGKISEALQTNPMDLIDLQNARSSFELPTQFESLSMMFPSDERGQIPELAEGGRQANVSSKSPLAHLPAGKAFSGITQMLD